MALNIATASTVAAATAATAVAAYIDARFHIRKDIDLILNMSRTAKLYPSYEKKGRGTLYDYYEDNTRDKQNFEAVWTREGTLTFGQLTLLSHKYANFFLTNGVKPRELVALNMKNSHDNLAAWIGLWAIGSAPALINYSLKGDALVHCLKVSRAKLALVDGEPNVFQRHIDVKDRLDAAGITCLDLTKVRDRIYNGSDQRPSNTLRSGSNALTPAGLFYTSGTTGMPKACIYPMITGFSFSSGALNRHFPRSASDRQNRCYNCMPLYHGTGGMCVLGQLALGQTVCIGKKFSLVRFWEDIRDSKATWFTYVGEVLRFLLAAPPSPKDREHSVHSVFGNGLRPDVWDKFKDRFGIDTIIEIFASTETVMLLFNACRGPFFAHSIGHHGALLRWLTRNTYVPVAIDRDTGDLWRDPKTGFAKRMPYEQGGEILVEMSPQRKFVGYYDNDEATEKKYARDVFKKGDMYYRSGDALRRDSDGRWYFMDRLGDTFRWKGENVSTAGVAQVLGEFEGVREVAVYGVTVPGNDGRAGSAAILIDPAQKHSFDWTAFLKHIRFKLPAYAIPVFVRVLPRSIAQHNHKLNKTPLQRDGINPANTQGVEMLWIEGLGKGSTYVPFGETEWNSLIGGKAKL